MGRGRGRRGGGSGGDRYEDQFGETMVGQDRAEHFGFGGRGGGGGTKGGDAGSRTKPGQDVSFIRHVPKFLQAHAHMLGTPAEEEPEAALLKQKYDDGRSSRGDDADDDEKDALRRAIELDPSLLIQHPELQSVADQAEAEAIKAKGNTAFAAGNMEEAVRLFTRCIELDGGNHIYFSNRAAALTSQQDYAAAVHDARRCTELQPRWAKGWSRLGAAYFGLEQFSEARAAYEQACRLEPSDSQLQSALQKAAAREDKEAAEGRHKFKRKLNEPDNNRLRTAADGGGRRAPAAKKRNLLSFGADE